MSVGQFFKLCNNSNVQQGGMVYRYLKVYQDKSPVHYPVYLVFHKDKIDFYFTGELNIKQKKENQTIKTEFIDTILFSLPLCEGNKTNNDLNTTLDWIAKEEFPFNDNYEIHKCPFYKQKDWYYNNEKIVKLLKWNLEKGGNNYDNRLIIRELFLDFLFDLNHTELFKSSPFYSHAKSQLFQNFYFEAISAKADFYYYLFIAKFNKNVFNKVIDKAKNNWANVIMKPGADCYIFEKNKKDKTKNEYNLFWFQDIEKELLLVCSIVNISRVDKKEYSLWLTKRNNLFDAFSLIFELYKIKRFLKSFWLTKRYSLFYEFSLILSLNKVKRNWRLCYFIISVVLSCFLIFYCFKIDNRSIKSSFELFVLPFFLGLWFFTFAFSTLITKSFNLSFRLIIFDLIIILSSAWFLIAKSGFLIKWLLISTNFQSVFLYSLLGLLTFILLLNQERELRSNTRTWFTSFPKSFIFFLLSLFYSLNISIIFGSINLRSNFEGNDALTEFWCENVFVKTHYCEYIYSPISTLNNSYTRVVDFSDIDTMRILGSFEVVKLQKNKNICLSPVKSKMNNVNTAIQTSQNSYYFNPKSYNDLLTIKGILKSEKPKKNELNLLFDNLVNLKSTLDDKSLIRIYKCSFFGFRFNIYMIESILWGQMFFTIFLGVFVQIIIQRKPLSS